MTAQPPWPTLLRPLQPYGAAFTRGALAERLRLTLIAAGHVLAMPVALVLAILSVLAVPLGLVVVGFLLAYAVVPVTAALVAAHRIVTAALLSTPIPRSYADTSADGIVVRPTRWLRDPARWRDVGFLLFAATGGFALSVLTVALLAAPVTYVVLLLTGASSLWAILLAIVLAELLLWWFVSPWLVRARLRAELAILDGSRVERLEHRVSQVEQSRARAVDTQSAEIRRIERDLHDGAQARLAAVGMSVGLAEKLLATDPQAAAELLRDARETTMSALNDLRSVVRGIHPPVLDDRGLGGAVEALTLSIPIPVTVSVALDRRLPAPLESAAYFAVAECLANTVKHARATRAWVVAGVDPPSPPGAPARVRLIVGDDGIGGASADGSGLTGVARRLGAFDGTLDVRSPGGGPTVVTMEIPCPTP